MENFTSSGIATGPLGATRLGSGEWSFVLWAPKLREASLHVLGPKERVVEMERGERDYYFAVQDLEADAQYLYRLEGSRELPDPASRFQPQGVHGPSQVIDTSAFEWTDRDWKGIDLE